jgi:hypothetical protein
MLVLATSERFLPAWGTFRAILASESHWLQPMLVLSVHWWLAQARVGSVNFTFCTIELWSDFSQASPLQVGKFLGAK